MYSLLIADDERLEREAMKYIIRRGTADIGNIIEAANGREAIEIVNRDRPDIAFLDIKMPGINGVETARRVKETCPECKIVFLTAFDTFDYAREALRLGAEDFLVKPVEDQRVLELLEKLVLRLQEENRERQSIDRTREALNEMIRTRESELSRQLSTGFLDTAKLNDFMILVGIESPRLELALLDVDLESYPMRVDQKQHANVLLTRCERLYSLEAEKLGMHCISGKLQTGVLMLFIGAKNSGATFADIPTGDMEQKIKKRVSLLTTLNIESGITDFQDLECRLSSLVAPGRVEDNESSLTLEESILRLMENGEDDDLVRAEAMVLRWLSTQSGTEKAMSKLDEILVVVRHELCRRFPGIEFPMDTKEKLSETCKENREAALRQILHHLRDAVRRQKEAVVHPAVHYAVVLMKKRFREDLSVDVIADLTGHSLSHLSRLFRQEIGVSMLDLLTRLRIDEAKKLLLQDVNKQIGQVAEEVGYRDHNYFSRVFRNEVGLSPRKYRLSAKMDY